jgi:phosphocarrier protein
MMAEDAPGPSGDTVARTVAISNRLGLHARAAARFVKLAAQFGADIVVCNRGVEVSGRSIMGLMMLAASPGTTIEIRASGADAAEALRALVALVEGRFDEE